MEFVRLDGWMVKRNSNIGRSQSIWGREMRFAAFLLDDGWIQLLDQGAMFTSFQERITNCQFLKLLSVSNLRVLVNYHWRQPYALTTIFFLAFQPHDYSTNTASVVY